MHTQIYRPVFASPYEEYGRIRFCSRSPKSNKAPYRFEVSFYSPEVSSKCIKRIPFDYSALNQSVSERKKRILGIRVGHNNDLHSLHGHVFCNALRRSPRVEGAAE